MTEDPESQELVAIQIQSQDMQQVPESQSIEVEFTKDEGVDDTQQVMRGKANKIIPRKRKPSERITKNKLKKVVVDKEGRGLSSEKAVMLE